MKEITLTKNISIKIREGQKIKVKNVEERIWLNGKIEKINLDSKSAYIVCEDGLSYWDDEVNLTNDFLYKLNP